MVEEFLKFVSNYDENNDKVRTKIAHTMRAREGMLDFAKKLGFSKEEVELASEIGLLHDIGRFEQAKVSNSFNINHKKSPTSTNGGMNCSNLKWKKR